MTGNAAAGAPKSASPAGCARSAEESPSLPNAACAIPAGRSGGRPNAPRYAKGKAEGRLYGGRDPKVRRRIGRERSRRRLRAYRDVGQCTRCGHRSPVQGGATCRACRDARQAAEREQYAFRRAAGQCGRCGGPAFDRASRCGPCAALEAGRHPRKNAASRRRYVHRRESWLCTDCGAPSQRAARCVPCAHRSWVRSAEHRGLPILPPRYTVIETATGEDHGTWDSWEGGGYVPGLRPVVPTIRWRSLAIRHRWRLLRGSERGLCRLAGGTYRRPAARQPGGRPFYRRNPYRRAEQSRHQRPAPATPPTSTS